MATRSASDAPYRGAVTGVLGGVLSALVFEWVVDPSEEQEWLMPALLLGLPAVLGVLAGLWADRRLAREDDHAAYALALRPVIGWGVGFAVTYAIVGHSADRRGVGTAILVVLVAALCCRATVTVAVAAARWSGRTTQ